LLALVSFLFPINTVSSSKLKSSTRDRIISLSLAPVRARTPRGVRSIRLRVGFAWAKVNTQRPCSRSKKRQSTISSSRLRSTRLWRRLRSISSQVWKGILAVASERLNSAWEYRIGPPLPLCVVHICWRVSISLWMVFDWIDLPCHFSLVR